MVRHKIPSVKASKRTDIIMKNPKVKKGDTYVSGVLKAHKRGHYLYDSPPE